MLPRPGSRRIHRQHLGAAALGLQVGEQQAQALAIGGAGGREARGNQQQVH